MLNYFRSKNKLVDKIYIQSVTEEAFLRQIRELQEKNKNLHSENARLRGLRDYSNRQDFKIQELKKERELIKTLKERIYVLEETIRIKREKTPDTAFISEDVVNEPLSAMLEAARKEAVYYKIRARENEEKRIKEEELQKEKEKLISKNHKLSGDLIKAFADISGLQTEIRQLKEQIKNDNDLYNGVYGEWAKDCNELENENIQLKERIKQLETENLGLLDKIANDNKSHDPELKIDLTKPIRWKVDKKQRYVEFSGCYGYNVKDAEGGGLPFKVTTEYINENYENYEPEPITAEEGAKNAKEAFKDCGIKLEDTGLGVNPFSVKDIVPKKEKMQVIDEPFIIKNRDETFNAIKENQYTVIDMTKKSKAVRAFLEGRIFRANKDNAQYYNKGMGILKRWNFFTNEELDKHGVTKDNIRKMIKKYIDKGLIETSDYHYIAAKPIKIILEKEK